MKTRLVPINITGPGSTKIDNPLVSGRLIFSSVLIAMLSLMVGCASGGPYRTLPAAADSSSATAADGRKVGHVVETDTLGDGYCTGYIELDEQGWFWMPYAGDENATEAAGKRYRSQVRAVETMITRASHLDELKPDEVKGVILVAFVHGWRNNAEPGNGNVDEFKKMLKALAAKERGAKGNAARTVVGVYVGWPGLKANVEPLETLSFYSRKNTGDKVGTYGGVTEILSRLEGLSEAINQALVAQATPTTGPSFYVVVGHSFGAEVVYDSILQVMTQRLAEMREANFVSLLSSVETRDQVGAANVRVPLRNPLQPFGDMVILVNPAFEGERYFNLKTFSEEWRYPGDQRPALAIFLAENDTATGFWFPVGRFFSTAFESYRPAPLGELQKDANRHTIPWTSAFVTHHLSTAAEYVQHTGKPVPDPKPWNAQSRVQPLPFADCVLDPISEVHSANWTPFYVVTATQKLINNHNGIWGGKFRDFLASFIANTDVKTPAQATRLSKNAAELLKAPGEMAPKSEK